MRNILKRVSDIVDFFWHILSVKIIWLIDAGKSAVTHQTTSLTLTGREGERPQGSQFTGLLGYDSVSDHVKDWISKPTSRNAKNVLIKKVSQNFVYNFPVIRTSCRTIWNKAQQFFISNKVLKICVTKPYIFFTKRPFWPTLSFPKTDIYQL